MAIISRNYGIKRQVIPRIKNIESLPIPLDLNLLKFLVEQQSPSYSQEQDKKRDTIIDWISKNVPEASIEVDAYGNTYITKGNTKYMPCIVSHLDIVHDYRSNFKVFNTDKIMFAMDMTYGTQTGVGGDDNCGIYICLELLKRVNSIKILLTLDEEVGMIGASKVNVDFLKNCSFLGQPDRRSNSIDFITHTNGIEVCNEAFTNLISREMKKYGYKKASGTATDIGEIKYNSKVKIPAFNATNGSYREHMDDEIILLDHLRLSLNFFFEVIKKVGYRPHEHISPIKPYYDYFDSWDEQCLEQSLCPVCYVDLKTVSTVSKECPSCKKKYYDTSIRDRRFD